MSTIEQEMRTALARFVDSLPKAADPEIGWSARDFDLEFLTDAVNDALLGADYLGALEELELIDVFANHVRTALVIACRATGSTWDEIGEAMGRDRQWAWRTYHRMADVTERMEEHTLREFENAIPNFADWIDVDSMDPEERKAVSLLERQAARAYERVKRAIALTTDARRRSFVASEQEAKRANRPGRRPGPQRGQDRGEST